MAKITMAVLKRNSTVDQTPFRRLWKVTKINWI